MGRSEEDTIGFRIRTARCNINMNQKQFAQEIGVLPNYLSRIERGKGKPSDDLLIQIAKETHTSYAWLTGTDGFPTDYPMEDNSGQQIKDSSATIGYLIALIRESCEENWDIAEPASLSEFPRTDWIPSYWFNLPPISKIERWAFDFSYSLYNQPDRLNKTGKPNAKLYFGNFLSNVIFSNPLIRNRTKYSFIVPDTDTFDLLFKKIYVPIGNVSIIQVDLENKGVVRESYLCTSADRDMQNYLYNVLTF